MHKYLVLIALLSHSFAFAQETQSQKKMKYANIYADHLLDQFDAELEKNYILQTKVNPLLTQTYSRLLAAREYIRKEGKGFSKYGEKSLVEITDNETYSSIVKKINQAAISIQANQKEVNKTQKKDLVYYPSFGASGNITGNSFPENVWSLTYDDGPHKSRTNEVIDELYKAGIKGTFFVLLPKARKSLQVIEAMIDSNMEVAHHTYHHYNLTKVTDEVLDYEVKGSLAELKDEFNIEVSLFRVPYGAGTRNSKVRQKIIDAKLIHIFWNIDTLDWKDKDPKSIFERAKKQMALTPNKSGIILFHDIHSQSVKASKLVLDYLIDEDKTICSVGEVINWFNNIPQSCL